MVPTCLARRKKKKAVVAGGRLWIYVWGKKIKRKTRKVETIDLSGLSLNGDMFSAEIAGCVPERYLLQGIFAGQCG